MNFCCGIVEKIRQEKNALLISLVGHSWALYQSSNLTIYIKPSNPSFDGEKCVHIVSESDVKKRSFFFHVARWDKCICAHVGYGNTFSPWMISKVYDNNLNLLIWIWSKNFNRWLKFKVSTIFKGFAFRYQGSA